MLTGFNHNINHAGQVYHIQTEDSGIKAPHIITHLFVGGNIIATKKTSYADVVGTTEIENVVRKMMEEQHKEMLRKLIHGAFDEAIKTPTAPLPSQAAAAAATPTAQALPARAPAQSPATTLAMPVVQGPATASPALSALTTASTSTRLPPPGQQTLIMTPVPPPPGYVAEPKSVPAPVRARGLAPAPVEIPDPPSIWNLPATQSSVDQQERAITQPDIPLAASSATQPEMAPVPLSGSQLPPEVLAARELEQPPEERPAGDTIFGEDLMSEKSLDEVILSYLADDPDGM